MDLDDQIELACLIEATARKPGNVHPGASFDDLTYDDFVVAARISAPILAKSGELGVGRAVLEAVKATVAETGTNVNLGICLLIAPLAAERPLKKLTVKDAECVYEAIRLSKPGGMGEAPQQDVRDRPTQTLWEVMKLAADRDGIAEQYAREFRGVTCSGTRILCDWHHGSLPDEARWPVLSDGVEMTNWESATIGTHLSLILSGDTLIRRKCGDETYQDACRRAEQALGQGLFTPAGLQKLTDFDAWLRADGHRRNPGTTADLIAAIWFAAIRDGLIVPPSKAEVLSHAARIRNAGRMTERQQ